MSTPPDGLQASASWFENPLIIRHVEEHLLFGPMSRHVSLGSLVLIGGLLSPLQLFFYPLKQPLGKDILDSINVVIMPLCALLTWYFSRRLSLRQQAITGWLATKSVLGLVCFLMLTAVVPMYFFQRDSNAWPVLFLALLWIPGIEFIPKVTPHQRYVTLARIALSIPCIHFTS
jgi:CDP-diglyceride synthetase